MIIIKTRRVSRAKILEQYPDAAIIDVTSKAKDEFIHLSPFFPHQGIPVPFSPDWEASCVEAVWQGLKVFEKEDIDTSLFLNTSMKGLKRTSNKSNNYKRGATLGHRKGVNGCKDQLLNFLQARLQIYAPTYRWVLENRAQEQVHKIQALSSKGTVVLLDYTTNCNIYDTTKPLSHAGLIKAYIEDTYPQ